MRKAFEHGTQKKNINIASLRNLILKTGIATGKLIDGKKDFFGSPQTCYQ